MNVISPANKKQIIKRNQLLQSSLRPEKLPFPITEEYPIVLSEKNIEYSYCLEYQNEITAHLNLWPRTLIDYETKRCFNIGLIGNVATDQKYRGKGFMKHLFQFVENRCKELSINAMILWSDLFKFYQNLGFRSLGSEIRFTFKVQKLRKKGIKLKTDTYIDPDSTKLINLEDLINLRYPLVSTIERSPGEFESLLKIPLCNLFVLLENDQICAYCILGKGYDMMGVIHEWGANNPKNLLSLVRSIGERLNIYELMLLAPGTLTTSWKDSLSSYASKNEVHSMAMVKLITESQSLSNGLENLFIWGLDSI